MDTAVYHVWFATKRRIWMLEGDVGGAAKDCLLDIAREKGIQLVECETAIDHVHLLLHLDKDQDLPKAMNLLKGISSYRLRSLFPQLKVESGLDSLWQRGYASRIIEPGSLATRRRYIRSQRERANEQVKKALMERIDRRDEGDAAPFRAR